MAFINCEFFSGVLGKSCQFNAIVPQKFPVRPAGRGGRRREYPVLFLLHGLSDDHSAWARWSSIERYVRERDLVVVMPDGGRSFYSDMKHGLNYWTFLADELPEIAHALLPINLERENTFAAGLSMGGYGALKLGLNHPERFAGVGALSAVTDIAAKFGDPVYADWQREFADIFGSPAELAADGNDLFAALEKARHAEQTPRIIQICGASDGLLPDNTRLRDAFNQAAWPEYRFEEHPGSHSWEFWDTHIQTVLDYLLERP